MKSLEEDISTDFPATILKRHPNATLYLDQHSAAHIPSLLTMKESTR
jgi:6-phosphogluconolactonase/glucosamine-6-phosphate isomerase/deaminase